MRRNKKYKIAILILAAVVLVETILLVYSGLARFKRARKVAPPLVPLKGKIAVVIDDWGYNLNNIPALEQIKHPLTMAVLPNLDYSESVSQQLYKMGFEIILHLPMEPYEKYRLEKNTIMTAMKESEIINILSQDLANVARAKGVSNHMGSRATANEQTMKIVLKELKERKLYFLDSFVSVNSVVSRLAAKMVLGFAKRDIFLDNKLDPGYIRAQIEKLKVRARVYGYAIGIGHARKVTLEVLKEVMPDIEKEGYKFVFISELVK